MKNFLILLVGCLLTANTVDAQLRKTNPIMVINCGSPATAKASTLKFNSQCQNGTCATGFACYRDVCYPLCPSTGPLQGTVCIDGVMVPDCASDAGCASCGEEDLYWDPSSQTCKCEDNQGEATVSSSYTCGCPPGLSDENSTTDAQNGTFSCVEEAECYTGDISFVINPTSCAAAGNVETSILIFVPIRELPELPLSLTLSDLENCDLTNGQNFLLELKDIYGANAAFVDDDRDGIIEIVFTRDPTMQTVIGFNNHDNIVLPPCAADPCSCDDPDNVLNPDGTVLRFHDVLTVLGTPGQDVRLVQNINPTAFTDADGNPIADDTVLGQIGPDGTFSFDFYRAPSVTVDILLSVNPLVAFPFTSECTAPTTCGTTPTPIPASGFLGMLILGLTILGAGYFLIRKVS